MTDRPPVIWPYDNEQVLKCDKCPQKIFFKKMPSGKFAPIEFDGEHTGQNHFIYCKAADSFRKPKEKQSKLDLDK